jgi:hypothetical protein
LCALIFGPPLLALAAIAAPLAFHAAMIVADVLGAIHADLAGRLLADAAREDYGLTHDSCSLLRLDVFLGRRGRTRRQPVLFIAAPLGFPVHHCELLLVLRGQIGDVLPQLIALGGAGPQRFR